MKVLVVFHIYHHNSLGYYLQKMTNIHSCRWDLIVTSSRPLEHYEKSCILAIKDDAQFLDTENVGYDIWPFIAAIKRVNLDDYDFVIKLHTKKEDSYTIKLNGIRMNGKQWKEYMVRPMLGTRARFDHLMEVFKKDESVGIAYARQLGFISKNANAEDALMLDAECSRLGIVRKKNHFCAGTMMAIRANALQFLKDDRIQASVFEQSGASHEGATMAHVYERLIPIAVQAEGYKYRPLYENRRRAVHFKIKDVATPVLEWIFSINHYGGKDKKVITVLGRRFIIEA